ncbi:Sec7 domain protein [Dictyocaulus viviparus]|uniref:Sec7 domain protein n=1 Tax=Dictyocaulus viviparus TaxID=29172 RepID=A0A0D8XFH6_DICVI|nr:Sec7 domain protein [Dictyocaulus viviparus]
MEVDMALRKAMQYFFLPREAEKIDKIIQEFAHHYARCNPKETKRFRGGWDTIHMIAFAIIMLNTDLHSPNIKSSQKMQLEQFIHNLRGQDKLRGEKDGVDIDRVCLQGIYERVRIQEIRPGDDHVAQVARVDAAFIGRDKPRLTETQRRLVCYCRLQQVLDPLRKQSAGSHERDVFLFNDMLVVGKAINKRRSSSRTSYTMKHWIPLLGASVHEFKKGSYEFGLTITSPSPDNHQIHFNARNYDDRCRFVADVIESIRESCQMEEVRLVLEMDAHTLRTDSQRDSGLSELDGVECPLARPGNSVPCNAGLVPPFRRLSFNSLDSGVVEEICEGNS